MPFPNRPAVTNSLQSRLGILIVILCTLSCSRFTGEITLVNHASETLSEVSVAICGQTLRFTNVLPGAIRTSSYEVRGDSSFDINVQFQSGRNIRLQDGYVTTGVNFKHEIDITSSNVELTRLGAQAGN